MTVAVMHPRFVGLNQQFFPSSATIQELPNPLPTDQYGQEIETWNPVPALTDIACAKAPLTAQERQAASYTATDQAWHVLLEGAYPTITTRHRAVIDGAVHDIDAAETDQTGTLTRLRVRNVEV